jgi:hypothetical protein
MNPPHTFSLKREKRRSTCISFSGAKFCLNGDKKKYFWFILTIKKMGGCAHSTRMSPLSGENGL